MNFNREKNTAQTSTPTTFVSRSAPQAHPIFLLKPIQYPTPNNPRFNQPATVIRPILSSNITGTIARPPLVRRFLRPTIIRPVPPRLIINENPVNRVSDPVTIQRQTPIRESSSIESSISTLSTISSNHEEIPKKKTCCYFLPCCRPKEDKSIKNSERNTNRPIYNYPNFKLKTRTIYIIIILLFICFLIVIILLIVLIAVRH